MGKDFEPPITIMYEGDDQLIHQVDPESGELFVWCSDMTCPCTAELYEIIGDLPDKKGDE